MLNIIQNTHGSIGAVEPSSPTAVDALLQQLLTRMDKYEDMMKLLTETMAENATLKKRIAEMEKSIGYQQQTEPKQKVIKPVTNTVTKTAATTVTNITTNNSPTSYAEAAATTTDVTTKRRKPTRPIPFVRAARLFTDPSPTHGFKFVYLPQKGRVSMGELRRSLSALKINNARILDVHFPARNTCALLIHTDFETTLLSALAEADIQPLTNFYPEDPAILNDPTVQLLSLEKKANLVIEIHKNRCIRIAARAPNRVQAALAYHFISNGIFSRTELNNYKYPPTNDNLDTTAPDTNMLDTNMHDTSNSEANMPQ